MSDEYDHLRDDAEATSTPGVSHPIAFVFLGAAPDPRVTGALRVAARYGPDAAVVIVAADETTVRVQSIGPALLRAGVRPDRIEVRRGAARYLGGPGIGSLIAGTGIEVLEVSDQAPAPRRALSLTHHPLVAPEAVSSSEWLRATADLLLATTSERPHVAAKRYIYAWGAGTAEGHGGRKDLLGGKGAGLAEMTLAGLPIPPGFTITTEACNDYFAAGKQLPAGLWDDVLSAMKQVEERSGKVFGDPGNPLLVSVRSGADFQVLGLLATVLNLGLNEDTVAGLIALSGNERFGWDAYRRFIGMFGRIVMDVKAERFDEPLEARKHAHGPEAKDTDLTVDDLRALVDVFKQVVREDTGRDFPTDVYEQLDLAIKAVFASWFGKRANDYRNSQKIAHDLGTAVNIVTMVFGNMGDDSGTGVAFTRNPNTGEKVLYGEYIVNAQGEDVVTGKRTPRDIGHMAIDMPEIYHEIVQIRQQLEAHYRDVQDLEFTIERGKLYMLQTRIAKRTAAAAVKIAVQMVAEGLITKEEAVARIEPVQVEVLLLPRVDTAALGEAHPLMVGLAASPGAAAGRAVFSMADATTSAADGEPFILVRTELDHVDVPLLAEAQAVVTTRGGWLSVAAVQANQLRKPCVIVWAARIDDVADALLQARDGATIHDGDQITVDGHNGRIYAGILPTAKPDIGGQPDLRRILDWASEVNALAGDDPHAGEVLRAAEPP